MTYCCENIREADKLIDRAQNKLNWRPEGMGFGDVVGGIFTLNTSTGVKLSNYLKRAIEEMIDAFKLLKEARIKMILCSCVSMDKYNELVGKYNELIGKCKEDVADYDKLVAESKVLNEKYNNLIDKHNDLVDRFNDVNTKYEEMKDRYEDTKDERESERINNTREIATSRQENLGLKGQLTRTQQRLTASESKVARIEDKLEARGREVLELKGKLESLSINVNNLEKSREELLNEKVNLKNEKLETFADNSGIDLDEINNLLRYYERLIHARKNYNQVNIETHEGNINRVKGMLRQNGVNVENTNKCCRKCEKVARLRIELNEIRQQQFEALQEVFPRQ